jgi:hypothetical protein
MTSTRRRTFALGGLLLVAMLAEAFETETRPVAVSPGGQTEVVAVAGPCPTFSWVGVEGVDAYDLAVWKLPVEVDGQPYRRARLPAGSTSWTPALADCLEPGRYAWTLRGLSRQGVAGWSEPSLFAVPTEPTPDEVRRALAVLERYCVAVIG